MCSRQKPLQIIGIRKGLGERQIFELKEGKEKAGEETERRARTKALRWGRAWFVPGPVGRLTRLKPGRPGSRGLQVHFTLTVMRTHEAF